MATINLGAIKFNWKGAYNSGTSYAVDDVVSSGGNSYVCIQAHSNQAVGNATAYWNIMSSAGTNGTDGTDLTSTLTTRGDIVFKGASALTRLPKGSTGQVLKQGANDPEWGADIGGKVLQVRKSSNTGVTNSSNNVGGKEFPNNMSVSNGVQICSVSITPQSTSSHFYVWFASPDAANGNANAVSAIFHGSAKKTVGSANCYSGDVGNIAMSTEIDTTSLSGAQTIQARNMGTHDGSSHYTCANHGGTGNGGMSTLIVMEIED